MSYVLGFFFADESYDINPRGFVRGYFDGDGHVWSGLVHKERKTQHRVLFTGFTSCSKPFLNDVHAALRKRGVVGGGVYCKKSAFCIKYSTSDSLRLYKIMYATGSTSELLLKRKREVFEQYLDSQA